MTTTFAQLGLPQPLVGALADRNIVAPFPVQTAAIPDALAGDDILGKAPTGSGKTLAFGLPLLARVGKAKPHQPRALILAPTRELAEQIKQELGQLAQALDRSMLAVYGGVGYRPQKAGLRRGADVLAATPGRLEDLMEQGAVDLSSADIVVIDEADRMADMGFLPAVRRILDRTSPQRQTLLFSATLDGDVAVLSRDYQQDPVRHEATAVTRQVVADASHHFWLVKHPDRVQHTADLVNHAGRSIVFTRTRHRADRLARQLTKLGIGAVALHGGRSQGQRKRALQSFASDRMQALIATDVAARGIHIDSVASVIHFDLPADSKDYVHRSGRTARAGATGTIISLVNSDQKRAVRRIQQDLNLKAPLQAPAFHELPARRPKAPKPASAPMPQAARSPKPRSSKGKGRSGGQSLYVGNLPWETTKEDINALFGRYGKVHKTTLITDRRTGRSRGFGFVDMPKVAAQTAVNALHGADLGGRDLTVRLARPQRRRN